MRRRGFSLLEVLIAVALAALVVGLSLVNLRRPREGAESRSVAEAVAEELRLARLAAMARHIPVAVGFPSANASNPICQGLYVLEGDEKPRVTRSKLFAGDFPGAVIGQAFWPLDSARMHDPALANTTADVLSHSSNDALQVSTWAPAAYARDTLFVFTPSGAVRTNGAVHFDGSYHLLVSEGMEYAAGNPGGGGTLAYAAPSRVCQPYTINLSLSGQISVSTGVTAGTLAESTGRIPTAGGPLPPALALGANASPTIVGVDVGPKNSDTMPAGVNVVVALDGHVTLRTRATDPNGDPLFCEWVSDGDQGTFSSPVQDRMDWDQAQGCWVCLWEWRPDPTMAVDDEVRLTCTVRDRSLAAIAAVSSSAINVHIGRGGRVVYTSYNDDGWADIGMVNLDGSGERLLTDTPDQDEMGASYSPDGQRIAYSVFDENNGTQDVWVMNYDGTGAHQLTNTVDYDEWPPYVWSPDGTRIACEGDDYLTTDSGIFVIAADGSNITSIATTSPGDYCYCPTWSRDGQALVFAADSGMWYYNVVSGGTPTRILTPPNSNVYYDTPAWSPTSDTVAYIKSDLADDELELMDVVPGSGAVSNQRHLFNPTHSATLEYWPSWNSAGTLLAFENDDGVAVSTTAGVMTQLFSSVTAWAYSPAWTPQGNVVYACDASNKPDGGMDLYYTDASASFITRLTSNPGDNDVTLQPASVR